MSRAKNNPRHKKNPLSDSWETPSDVFNALNEKYGPFDLDPAASLTNFKTPIFYTEEENGLSKPWYEWTARKVWINPPYSDVGPWLKKAKEEASKGCTVVVLLKDDHTTQWYKDYVFDYSTNQLYPGVEKIDWPKRIKFKVPAGMTDKHGRPVKSVTPPWPNVVVIFRPIF